MISLHGVEHCRECRIHIPWDRSFHPSWPYEQHDHYHYHYHDDMIVFSGLFGPLYVVHMSHAVRSLLLSSIVILRSPFGRIPSPSFRWCEQAQSCQPVIRQFVISELSGVFLYFSSWWFPRESNLLLSALLLLLTYVFASRWLSDLIYHMLSQRWKRSGKIVWSQGLCGV